MYSPSQVHVHNRKCLEQRLTANLSFIVMHTIAEFPDAVLKHPAGGGVGEHH